MPFKRGEHVLIRIGHAEKRTDINGNDYYVTVLSEHPGYVIKVHDAPTHNFEPQMYTVRRYSRTMEAVEVDEDNIRLMKFEDFEYYYDLEF